MPSDVPLPPWLAVPPVPGAESGGEEPAVVETHISTLFFVGDRVYKRKKPVRFGFLDFSTAAKRRAACHREVELNRRLAPEVYLGVVDVPDDAGRPDAAVLMRRMDAHRRLATLVGDGDVGAGTCVDAVAELLATFHRRAERSADIDRAASAAAVRKVWDDGTVEMAPFVGSLLDPEVVEEVTARYRRFIDGRSALFAGRCAAGWVCDGHGDLQADDVFCTPDGPRILDCIEFDDRLRYGDVLADVAFLAMDLERLGAGPLASRLVARWVEAYGDPAVADPALLHHYIAARAQVRAKVACLRAAQHPPGSPEATACGASAGRLLALCAAHLAAAEVRLVLVGGTPGSGKTTLATQLADRPGWEVVHSDVVRNHVAVVPGPDDGGPGDVDSGRYRPHQVAATYEAMLATAQQHLELGRSVVLDASWTDAAQRARARQVALGAGATLVELRCACDPRIARQRVAARTPETAGGSEATPEVADLLVARADPWPEAVAIDTTGAPADSLTAAVGAVGPTSAGVGGLR